MNKFTEFIKRFGKAHEGSTLKMKREPVEILTVSKALHVLDFEQNVCIASDTQILATERAGILRKIDNESFNRVLAKKVEKTINENYPERTLYILVK